MPLRAAGKTPGFGGEAEARVRRASRPRSQLGFPWEKARQDRVNSFTLVSGNGFRGLWAVGLVPSCLVPASGMIKAEKYCFLGSMGQRKG